MIDPEFSSKFSRIHKNDLKRGPGSGVPFWLIRHIFSTIYTIITLF